MNARPACADPRVLAWFRVPLNLFVCVVLYNVSPRPLLPVKRLLPHSCLPDKAASLALTRRPKPCLVFAANPAWSRWPTTQSTVVTCTPQVSKFPLSYMFAMCSLFLGVCAVCQRRLEGLVGGHSTKNYEAVKVQGVIADGPV